MIRGWRRLSTLPELDLRQAARMIREEARPSVARETEVPEEAGTFRRDGQSSQQQQQQMTRPTAMTAGLYRLSCYCGPSNTTMTFSDAPSPEPKSPPAKVHFALSAGQMGFKKAGRGGYEPAYQLAFKAFERILGRDSGQKVERRSSRLLNTSMGSGYPIKQIELTMNGYGLGRQAISSALLAEAWSDLRPLIKRLTDTTPLKIGGTRPKKMRRL